MEHLNLDNLKQTFIKGTASILLTTEESFLVVEEGAGQTTYSIDFVQAPFNPLPDTPFEDITSPFYLPESIGAELAQSVDMKLVAQGTTETGGTWYRYVSTRHSPDEVPAFITVHYNEAERTAKSYSHPHIRPFTESWFAWLRSERARGFDWRTDSDYDDDLMGSVLKHHEDNEDVSVCALRGLYL
ncbi:MAG: hypothetical protein HC893_09455 [Chloroflexaceae bacterium]|nr:hypothetical protein [Chloroflexaceae bacterium]